MRSIFYLLTEMGKTSVFLKAVTVLLIKNKFCFDSMIAQLANVCVRSLPNVFIASVGVGGIILIQFHKILADYQAVHLLGGLNTSAFIRDLGPFMISFLLSGRIGAYTTAELATMRVTNQIDAMESLGTDSLSYLILPRWIAIILSNLLLHIIGLAFSIISAILIAKYQYGINELQFINSIPQFASFGSLFEGIFKAAVYGTIIATVCCYYGMMANGGATGVGKAVTKACVFTNLYLNAAHYIVCELIASIGPFIEGCMELITEVIF